MAKIEEIILALQKVQRRYPKIEVIVANEYYGDKGAPMSDEPIVAYKYIPTHPHKGTLELLKPKEKIEYVVLMPIK